MEPIFKKCLLAMEKINESSFPMMDQAYKTYIDTTKQTIIASPCLNDAKSYADAAKETHSSGVVDNRNVKQQLEKLIDIGRELEISSKDLHELLSRNQDNYLRLSKDMVNKNNYYLNEMKNGNTPARELLVDIVNLGKKIQHTINEDIPNFKRDIMAFLKKTENKVCSRAYDAHNKIQKLDSGTLPRIRTREWTYLESGFFERNGAFVVDDYDTL